MVSLRVLNRKIIIHLNSLILLLFFYTVNAHALQNHTGAHDPSSIIKCEDTYWIFTTGNGIYAMYSNDLVKWTAGKTPFSIGSFPAWITGYVPAFEGHFWAPECIYMNGKYYLYYSCSSWGSKKSAIGLLTNKTLNPDSKDYYWQDEGMVVYSTEGGDVNCIDPSVFRDDDGKIWLTYGSYFGGIRIAELDNISGKTAGTYHIPVATGDCEASYVINHDTYYYLFINRGSCCQGLSSTYYIQVGRSLNPTGPFLDKTGRDLFGGGGTTVLSTSGDYIGPGCLGYFIENGTEWISYHYYDGANYGNATLNIGTVFWDDSDWPVITSNWIDDGTYTIINSKSNLVWQYAGAGFEDVILEQGEYIKVDNQKWTFQSVGTGNYKIYAVGAGLIAKLEGCSGDAGKKIVLGNWQAFTCDIWKVERTSDDKYVLSSNLSNRVAEVIQSSIITGTQLQINNYSGSDNQKWKIKDTSFYVSSKDIFNVNGGSVILYPNPSPNGVFTIELGISNSDSPFSIAVFTLDGRQIQYIQYEGKESFTLDSNLKQGVYMIQVRLPLEIINRKLIIQ